MEEAQGMSLMRTIKKIDKEGVSTSLVDTPSLRLRM